MTEDLCLAADKKRGELVRRFMVQKGLLDLSKKIETSGGLVLIPLSREILPQELEAIKAIAPAEIMPATLSPANNRPKKLQEILSDVLPSDLLAMVPKSHDVVGDIMILEDLPEELNPYKKELGLALLKTVTGSKVVLLKIGKVEGEFRLPQLEVIAGEKRFETMYTEYGLRLKVDLSKVYFSPRLGFERYRVAKSVADGETVVDLFAGLGPFSLMIAKYAKAKVYAVDINPDAILLMEENIKINRLCGEVIPICADARGIVEKLRGVADHVIMNLPGRSLEFVGIAFEVVKSSGGTIHLYTFASDKPLEAAELNFRLAASGTNRKFEISISRIVKPVAPRKWQVALDIHVL